ncbi:MAG: hypothetical protein ABSG43_26645 [Solirubrobacteraceae bacterium]
MRLDGRFATAFELSDQHSVRAIGRASNFVLYHLVRTATGAP